MGRTRSPDIQKRNDVIYAEWLRGASLTTLGERYSLSRQVVGRIVAANHPEEPEDDDRALYRGYMWRLYDEVQQIGDRPGYKMTPRGGIAEDEDGSPALDTNVQVQAKELQLKILRELRLLDGRDRPQHRTLAIEVAQRQADEALAAIAAKRAEELRELDEARQLKLVRGEVVGELPPSQPEAS